MRQADYILIPVFKKDHKKLLKYLAACEGQLPSPWSKQALLLAENHEPDYKKFIEQWVGKQKLILMGLGDERAYQKIAGVCRLAVHKQEEKPSGGKIVLVLPDYLDGNSISALANGLALSAIRLDYYKSEKKGKPAELAFFTGKKSTLKSIEAGIRIASTQEEICHLVNLPPNEINPQYLAGWARRAFHGRPVKVEILEEEALAQHKMGALLAVGMGSETPPRLLVLDYQPSTRAKKLKHIGLVGKGVTFDTGGISLKDPANMHLMKSDMGGAAAVLGAVDLAEKSGLAIRLTAVIPLAENAIGPASYRPGDVIHSYSGKSIEIIDTDAEGRLILADALAYLVKKYKPEIMVDLATLTGSCIMTLGNKAAGLFTNNERLAQGITAAGEATGERVWRLPLWKEFEEEMHSDIADIKNLATKPVAGASTAAKFLEAFTSGHPAWAHLDIAGVAMVDSDFSKMRSATAYGVHLLVKWMEEMIKP